MKGSKRWGFGRYVANGLVLLMGVVAFLLLWPFALAGLIGRLFGWDLGALDEESRRDPLPPPRPRNPRAGENQPEPVSRGTILILAFLWAGLMAAAWPYFRP